MITAADAGLLLSWDADGRSTWRFAACATGFSGALQVRDAGAAGLGVFALRRVDAGERLLTEAPLIEWSIERDGDEERALEAAVAALAPSSSQAYWALCQNAQHGSTTKRAYGIWLSNALPTDDEPASAAVFRLASRLNHACRPNCHLSWNTRRRCMTLHALEAIPQGAELTIHYTGGGHGQTHAERRDELRRSFDFVCGCGMCELGPSALAASDKRQASIASLGRRIAATPTPSNLVDLVSERLALLRRERMLGTAWDTMGAAVSYLSLRGDATGAARWAARAASCAATALGRDSDEFEEFQARLAPLGEAWLKAGRRLERHGHAVFDDFAGAALAAELRCDLRRLYRDGMAAFDGGQVGGGADGQAEDVRTAPQVRGDRRALVSTTDPRAPSLGALFLLCDELIGTLARGPLPALAEARHRSRPMLACYPGGGARYVKHVDNPDGNGRILTCIYYLNDGWSPADGGELVLYPKRSVDAMAYHTFTIEPRLDRLVLFWSDGRTPHEVRPAQSERLAVSTWYHTAVPT